MGSDTTEVIHAPKNFPSVKVHNSICWELTKILDKTLSILPAIEAARPGCTAGIQELCNLNNAIEKAKLLIQHCAESSKLYLAITSESIVLRCERIRSSLDVSLFHIQNLVPQVLAAQISGIQKYLKDVKFIVDLTEDEAGKAMLHLLRQTDSSEEREFKAFQTAVVCLKITSPKALLIERRSIKKLLDSIHGSEPKKEKILNYFLFLIKKFGRKVKADTVEHEKDQSLEEKCVASNPISVPDTPILEKDYEPTVLCEVHTDPVVSKVPPEEFCCPISSRLMYDPVIIASGQTFERASIEKWFREGHNTCPKTQKKLMNLYTIPNSSLKKLISSWCSKHGIYLEDPLTTIQSWDSSCCSSISSLKNVSAALLDGSCGDYIIQSDHSSVSFISSDASYCSDSSHVKGMDSLRDNRAQFSWSDDYLCCQSFYNFRYDAYLGFFRNLCELPLDNRDKAVENMKQLFVGDEEMCYAMLSNGFVEALMTFMKNARDLSDLHAQKTGAQIFLAFLNNNRIELPYLGEDTFQLMTSFLESEIALEALKILQNLSHRPSIKSITSMSCLPASIISFLDGKNLEFRELSIKILVHLSSHKVLRPQIVSSGCVPKLVPLMSDGKLSELCLKILHNLRDTGEALTLIAETNGCIALISELLETESREGQEHGVAILHSLCSQSLDYCLLVMKEGVIPSLVDISVNGNAKGKEYSMNLLYLLKDLRLSGSFENSDVQPNSISEQSPKDPNDDHSVIKQPNPKPSGFFGKKMRFLFKQRPVVHS